MPQFDQRQRPTPSGLFVRLVVDGQQGEWFYSANRDKWLQIDTSKDDYNLNIFPEPNNA